MTAKKDLCFVIAACCVVLAPSGSALGAGPAPRVPKAAPDRAMAPLPAPTAARAPASKLPTRLDLRPKSARPAVASEPSAALAAHWKSLVAKIDPASWSSPRINLRTGKVTNPVWMSGTTDSETYHNGAIEHPLTSRFALAETWDGPRRSAKQIRVLVRDRASGQLAAEIVWQADGTHLTTATETRGFTSTEEALQAFFEAQPGFGDAKRQATHASPVTLFSQGAGGTRIEKAGVLRPSHKDPKNLVYQGQGDAESPVLVLDPDALPSGPIRLRPGQIFAVAGSASLPPRAPYPSSQRLLTDVGVAEAPKSGTRPEVHLFSMPEGEAGAVFEVVVRRPAGTPIRLEVRRDGA